MAGEPLTEAGLHYGEAFCVPESKKGAPLSALTPEEQNCVRRVGIGWENDIVAKLGGIGHEKPFGAPLDPPKRYSLKSRSGHEMGSLTMDSGDVTLCLHSDGGKRTCAYLGHGEDALNTARKMLPLMNLEVHD